MEIDYTIAFITFLVFSVMALAMYINNFSVGTVTDLEAGADRTNEIILGYLEADVYSIPTRFSSSGGYSDKPLYFNFTWPFGQNSTRVYYEGGQVACKIEGNAIHWQSDLHDGWNYFNITFANNTEVMNCTGTYDTTDENQTIPWAQEKRSMILQSSIHSMQATDVDAFKSQQGISRDFRVEINASGSVASYGKIIPDRSDVYLRTTTSQIFENGTAAVVSVWVW
ncbi:MAG: hypothetical protein ABIH90_01230 [Candidatus Aenigmatarchaeota archaeon]